MVLSFLWICCLIILPYAGQPAAKGSQPVHRPVVPFVLTSQEEARGGDGTQKKQEPCLSVCLCFQTYKGRKKRWLVAMIEKPMKNIVDQTTLQLWNHRFNNDFEPWQHWHNHLFDIPPTPLLLVTQHGMEQRTTCREGACVHFSAGEYLAPPRGAETRAPSCLRLLLGKQIKDVSHFWGCKSAPGDGSGVCDTPNPPSAASTYRLPIHVSSKWTLPTSSIIKCSLE